MKGIPSGEAHERRHVARARHVSGLVEAVRILEVRVGETQLVGFLVHQPHETIDRSRSDMKGERLGGVVRARDERRPQQLGDGQLLTRAQVDGRLADPRRLRAHGHDVVQVGVLEHHDRCHQLRDAGDGSRAGGIVPGQYGTVVSDEVPRSGRDRRLGRLGAGTRGKSKGRECGDESDDGEQSSAHQRATMYCRSATSPPRPRPGRRAAGPPPPRPSASPRCCRGTRRSPSGRPSPMRSQARR